MVPRTTASAPSSRPTAESPLRSPLEGHDRCAGDDAQTRVLVRPISAMSASVMPSAKYSGSAPAGTFSKGSTARVMAAAGRGLVSSGRASGPREQRVPRAARRQHPPPRAMRAVHRNGGATRPRRQRTPFFREASKRWQCGTTSAADANDLAARFSRQRRTIRCWRAWAPRPRANGRRLRSSGCREALNVCLFREGGATREHQVGKAPSAKMSARWSTTAPSSCSGRCSPVFP